MGTNLLSAVEAKEMFRAVVLPMVACEVDRETLRKKYNLAFTALGDTAQLADHLASMLRAVRQQCIDVEQVPVVPSNTLGEIRDPS